MEVTLIWQALIFSGGIFMIMEILKHFFKKYKFFNKHKPIMPLIIGGAIAPFVVGQVVAGVPWFIAIFGGMLAGSFSSSVYEVLEGRLEKFKEGFLNDD